MSRTIVRVTEETTRPDLAETLGILNTEAMRLSRQGYTGTRSVEYAVAHDRINMLLAYWLEAAAGDE